MNVAKSLLFYATLVMGSTEAKCFHGFDGLLFAFMLPPSVKHRAAEIAPMFALDLHGCSHSDGTRRLRSSFAHDPKIQFLEASVLRGQRCHVRQACL